MDVSVAGFNINTVYCTVDAYVFKLIPVLQSLQCSTQAHKIVVAAIDAVVIQYEAQNTPTWYTTHATLHHLL